MKTSSHPVATPLLVPGTIVRHVARPAWVLGKVIQVQGEDVSIYFKSISEGKPETHVVRISRPGDFLEVVSDIDDPDLANLPPYSDGRFRRQATELTLAHAKRLFLGAFPLGFGDPAYLAPKGAGEREYKLAAHHRYLAEEENGLSQLADGGTGIEIRAALERIYRSPNLAQLESLNLMHPRFEAPRFFEALDDTQFARMYIKASCAFIAAPDPVSFEALAAALEHLPGNSQNPRIGKWPFLTWLPFIAEPARHMMIRPNIVSGFASILPFEIGYRSELNYEMYRLVVVMSVRLRAKLVDTELNLGRRNLDMIDMQSFMWVVQRYFEPSALELTGG